jgi:Resolvase, N terminal domain
MTTAAYLRVSTRQQSVDQQHDAIAAAGITPDRVFTDTASGRAGSKRPGWTCGSQCAYIPEHASAGVSYLSNTYARTCPDSCS